MSAPPGDDPMREAKRVARSIPWDAGAASRDVDALIAQHVEGWHAVPQPKDYDGLYGGELVLVPPTARDFDHALAAQAPSFRAGFAAAVWVIAPLLPIR